MSFQLNEDIAETVTQQGRPVEVTNAAGHVFVVMTQTQFRQHVYDDDDLSDEEMVAAASLALDDPDGWGAPGMDEYDQEDSEAAS
jgi:hypothetical protein